METQRDRAVLPPCVRVCSVAPYTTTITKVPAIVVVAQVGEVMFMGLLDRPRLAGEASYGCVCCSYVVYTMTLLAADACSTEGHMAVGPTCVRAGSVAPNPTRVTIRVPAVIVVSIVGEVMSMGLLDRPCLAGEASLSCTCCPGIVHTKTLLTADATGWVSTGGASLPLAGSCGGGGAGEGEGGTLPTAALLLPIGTLETRGGAGETFRVLGTT